MITITTGDGEQRQQGLGDDGARTREMGRSGVAAPCHPQRISEPPGLAETHQRQQNIHPWDDGQPRGSIEDGSDESRQAQDDHRSEADEHVGPPPGYLAEERPPSGRRRCRRLRRWDIEGFHGLSRDLGVECISLISTRRRRRRNDEDSARAECPASRASRSLAARSSRAIAWALPRRASSFAWSSGGFPRASRSNIFW